MSPAKVRYELPGKRQRQTPVSSFAGLTNDSESEDLLSSAKQDETSAAAAAAKKNQKLPFKLLPTPAKSSQPQVKVDMSIGTFNFQLRLHYMAQNAVLFEAELPNANTWSPDSLEDSEDDINSPESMRQIRSSSNFIRSVNASKRKHRRAGTGFDGTYSSSDGSAAEDDAITPSKKKAKRTPTKVKKTPTKSKTVVIDSDSDSDDGEPAMALPTRSTRQKSVTLSDSSEDEIAKSSPRRSQRRTSSSRNGKNLYNSPSVATSFQARGKKPTVESDEDEDDIRSSPPKRLARLAIPDDEDEDEEEEDVQLPSSRKRRPKATVESDEDESDPIMLSPLKRTRQPVESDESDIKSSPSKRRRKPHRDEVSSDSDLPSPGRIPRGAKSDSTSKTPPRFTRQQKTARRHRTEKEKKMELLKRRRAGENIEQVTDSESESDEENDDDEFQKLSEFEDEEESPEQARKPAKRSSRNRGQDSDDDFVVEDDEGPLGIPDHMAQIPLEFTHAAHKPIKEHFRDVVEWMVQNKVNPGFSWDDPVYTTAFQKVDAECGGFADSKFVSTQWTAEFTKAIYARPILVLRELEPGEAIDVLGETKCEACNHRKHVPTFSLQFKGKAYNKTTLEEIDQESSDEDSSDDDSEDEKLSVNEKGQTILSEDKEWFAGR